MGQGFFPLDEQLGLGEGQLSPGLKKQVVWLSAKMSFKEAQKVLSEIGDVAVSHTQIWRESQEAGEKFKGYEVQRQTESLSQPKRNESAVIKVEAELKLGASLDGGMMYIREEGWKEFKAGCVYQIESCQSYDPHTHQWEEVAHARDNTYVAHLGGPAEIGQLLWAEAQARGWNKAGQTQIIGDGAKWIWGIADTHFYDSHQTVDWFHACSHLHSVAQILYPDNETHLNKWLRQQKTRLYQGHALPIAHDLSPHLDTLPPSDASLLASEVGYFLNNHAKMPYLQLREDAFLIGSGTIESGIKQFKSRLCGPGMHWSRHGAETILALRSAVLSDHFDLLWQQVQISPPF